MLVNVWHPAQHSKTTVIADNVPQALDAFCQRHGYADHADYCRRNELAKTNLNSEVV